MPAVCEISVVVATHNRAPLLRKALDGLEHQTLEAHRYEVIVVDNNSTDQTRDVTAEFSARSNQFRYLFEGRPGVTIARNSAWQSARAEFVAFLDDDAIPPPDWLERILGAFRDTSPSPACVGGVVEPVYEVPPPEWLKGPLLDFVTVVNHGPHPFFLSNVARGPKLASANMAVRKDALLATGGFHEALDRVGSNLLSGGEVLLQLQLEALQLPIYYDPQVRVRHLVGAQRLTRRWMENRAYWGGVSDALVSFFRTPQTFWWALRTVSWSSRACLKAPRSMAKLVHSSSDDSAVLETWDGWNRLGCLMGAWQAVMTSFRSRPRPVGQRPARPN